MLDRYTSRLYLCGMATITDVQIRLDTGSGRLVAFADITLDNEFKVRGLRILKGTRFDESRYLVQFPTVLERSSSNDIAHPTNPVTRKRYEDAVVDAYLRFAKTASRIVAVSSA